MMNIMAHCKFHNILMQPIGAGIRDGVIYLEVTQCKGCLDENSTGFSDDVVSVLTQGLNEHPMINGKLWDGPCECTECLTS